MAEECNDLAVFDVQQNETLWLAGARGALQACVRIHPVSQICDRFAQEVRLADLLLQYGATESAQLVRRRCPVAAATFGALLILASSECTWRLPTPQPLIATLGNAYQAIDLAVRTAVFTGVDTGWPFFALLARMSETYPQHAASAASDHHDVHNQLKLWLSSGNWLPSPALRDAVLQIRHVPDSQPACSPVGVATTAVLEGSDEAVRHIRKCRALHLGQENMVSGSWASVWYAMDRLTSPQKVDVLIDSWHALPRAGALASPEAYYSVEKVQRSRSRSEAYDSRADVVGDASRRPKAQTFRMSVLPPHIGSQAFGASVSLASFRFVADHVRAFRRPHCNLGFHVFVDALDAHVQQRRPLTIVDVGAHMGDCCLWAAASLGPGRVKCIAFEANADAAAVLRRSIVDADLGDSVELHEVELGNASSCNVLRGVPLDCFVKRTLPKIDLVKIHVEGSELNVFAGLLGSLRAHRVQAAMVRGGKLDMGALEAFLIQHGVCYTVQRTSDALHTVLVMGDWCLAAAT